MANKKRKLNKAKEALQKATEKHLCDRCIMLYLLVFVTLVTIAALAVRLYIITVGFSTADICFCSALFVIACAGPVLRIIWNNIQIRAIKTQIAEKDQQILEWNQRLQEIAR